MAATDTTTPVNNNNGSNFNNNTYNNTNKKNLRTESQKKSVTFNIKQQKGFFLELDYKNK
jgi:hypothetical protein